MLLLFTEKRDSRKVGFFNGKIRYKEQQWHSVLCPLSSMPYDHKKLNCRGEHEIFNSQTINSQIHHK
jgi:hypothetical protein